LRRGDLTLRILHYQTAPAARQPLAMASLIATINRERRAEAVGINRICGHRRHPLSWLTADPQCDPSHIACAMLSRSRHARLTRLTFPDDNGLVLISANRDTEEK